MIGDLVQMINSIRRSVALRAFRIGGMKPWSRGYSHYKIGEIRGALRSRLDPSNLPQNYGFRIDERVIEYPWFFSKLPESEGRLLDAGSVLNHDFVIEHPKLANKEIFVTTLAPETRAYWDLGVSYIYGDMRDLSFRDNFFDWIACISTLEHVGMDNRRFHSEGTREGNRGKEEYLTAVQELRRVLKYGGTLYLSMPFGTYADHGWFQIFDGPMVDHLVSSFNPDSFTEEYFLYTPDGWVNSSREQTAGATFFDINEREDYDADFAAAARGIVALTLTK